MSLFLGYPLVLIFLEITEAQYPHCLTVKDQQISQYGLDWGTNSYGYLQLINRGVILQTSASLTCCRMTSVRISPTASLTQDSGSNIQLSNFSQMVLDSGCALSTLAGSKIQYQSDSGGGKSHIYCLGCTWTLGYQSSILLGSLTNLYITANSFTIGPDVTITMDISSSLEILDDMVIKDLVHLTLAPRSRFFINPGSGNVATITSSDSSTLTTVQLDDSAVLIANGTFTVGDGTATTMVMQPNSAVTISSMGQLVVEATSFVVGQSSYWEISGSFRLDKSSKFQSGIQSDLSISGSLETKGGSLVIGDFASMMIQGSCSNQGMISVDKSSQMTIMPGAQVTLEGGTLSLGSLASAVINGSFSLGVDGVLTVKPYSFFTSLGTFELSSAELTIESYCNFVSQGFTTIQGPVTLSQYSYVQVTGSARLQSVSGLLSIGQRGSLQVEGRLELFSGSGLTVSNHASLSIGSGTTIVLSGGAKLTIGEHATVMFSPGMFCTLNGEHSVPTCTILNVTTNTVGFTCFPS